MSIFAAGAKSVKVICSRFLIPTRDARFAAFLIRERRISLDESRASPCAWLSPTPAPRKKPCPPGGGRTAVRRGHGRASVPKRGVTNYRTDRRRRHYHWLAMVPYSDNETFGCVCIGRERGRSSWRGRRNRPVC